MASETISLEIIVTATEVEALLLESNLIKKLRPRLIFCCETIKALRIFYYRKTIPLGG